MNSERVQFRADGAGKRDVILAETLRIVGQRGYHGFGIQELAQRCGLTKPGLLHHFSSKDQLLLSLLNEIDARDEAEVAALFADELRAASDEAAVRATFRRSLRSIAERSLARPELTRLRVVLGAEAINPGHPAHPYFKQRHKAKLDRLARGAARFSTTPETIARLVLATLTGLEEQWLREEAGFDLLAEWDRFLDLLLP
jgi:AcrR family transcriptional regulator